MNKANQLFQLIRQFWNNAVAVFTKRKVSVIITEIDNQILQQSTAEVWTAESFLYDVFLTQRTHTSSSPYRTPIEIYNAYRTNEVDIGRLCELGVEIMNYVASYDEIRPEANISFTNLRNLIEGIKPCFSVKYVWWRYASENLFGINLFTSTPRLHFHRPYMTDQILKELCEDFDFTHHPEHFLWVCRQHVGVKDLEVLFNIRMQDCLETDGPAS